MCGGRGAAPEGVITVKDVATANMDVLDTYILAESQTSYQNVIDTLGAPWWWAT